MTVHAISDPELLSGADYHYMSAIPDEDAGFTCPDEDCAVFALVDVYAGCRVEEGDGALLAVRYLELLEL